MSKPNGSPQWAMLVGLGFWIFSPHADAQHTGWITDTPVITIGSQKTSTATGFCSSDASSCGNIANQHETYGSISPTTTVEGLTYVLFADIPADPKKGDPYQRTGFSVSGFASDPGQGWLVSASCNGVTYNGATARNYSFSNGHAGWSWSRLDGAQPAFQGRSGATQCTIYHLGTSGWIRPKYQVVGLTYAPPGSRSTASYTNGFMSGTSTSHQSSFVTGVTEKISVTGGGGFFGIFGGDATNSVSVGWTQQQDSSNSLAIMQQQSNGLIVPGPASSAAGVNHDYDTVYVWLNPEVFLEVFDTVVAVGGYGYDARDTVTGMDVIPLTVGQLRGTQAIPPGTQARLNRSWDPSLGALTTVEYQDIMRADPFASDPGFNPNTDPTHRYELPLGGSPPQASNLIINYTPVPAGGQPTGQTYSSQYSATSTLGSTSKDTYTVSYSNDTSANIDFIVKFQAKLNFTTTFTTSNSASSTQSSSATQSANFTIFPPVAADNYTGPTAIQVWKDNVYGTFMFYPEF